MWGLLRIILLVVTAFFLARIIYVISRADQVCSDWVDCLWTFGAVTFLVLNAVYLISELAHLPSRQDN